MEYEKADQATVVQVIDKYTIVINRGSEHGVKFGERFLVYSLSDKEITDPETGKSLGFLEINKGSGTVIHVQDKMATIESDRKRAPDKKITRRKIPQFPDSPPSISGMLRRDIYTEIEEEEITTISEDLMPFKYPRIGDKVKPI